MKRTLLRGLLFSGLMLTMGLNPAWSETPFIEGKIELQRDPARMGGFRYLKPGLDLKRYDRIVINPVEIWIHPDSKYKGIQPDDLKILADNFRRIVVDELEPAYPVVDKPGPGTMVARLAVTGVKLEKKKRGLFGYTPVGFVATSAMGAGENMSMGKV